MSPSSKSSTAAMGVAGEGRFWLRCGGVFGCLATLLYFPAITSYFSSDDFLHLATVMEGGLPFATTGDGRGFLRPVVGWNLWLEYQLWGQNAIGYHVSNVLMHLCNSLLVVLLCRCLLPRDRGARTTAVCAGLIFLTLACHAEPVSWISGRTDLLATFFSLAALSMAAQGLQSGSGRLLLGASLSTGVALFAKESALAVPVLIGAMGVYFRATGRWQMERRAALWTLAAGVAVLGVYFAVRWYSVGAIVGGYGVRGHLRFHQDLLAQAMARYAWRVFLPPLPRETAALLMPRARLLADLATVLFLLHGAMWALLAWKHPGRRTGFFLYAAFWMALLPSINLRIQWTDSEAERFLYLASVFAAMGAAWALVAIPSKAWRNGALTALIACQSIWLWQGCTRWQVASGMARDIIAGVQAGAGDDERLLLLNKPDSYDGALIFRTGFQEAIRHFGPAPRPEASVEALFASTLYQRDHVFEVSGPAISDDGPLFTLRATDETSVMVEEDRLDSIEVLDGDGRTYTFRFHSDPAPSQLLYFRFDGVYEYDTVGGVSQPAAR